MKKNSDSPLTIEPSHPGPLNTPARARVRYIGFEGIDGGRRLGFSVKLLGHNSIDITVEISDASFNGASGISIQNAAPMAYEKLVQLLATEDVLESNKIVFDGDGHCTLHSPSPQSAEARSFNE